MSVAIAVAIVVVVDVRRERARGQRGGIIKIEGRGRGKWRASMMIFLSDPCCKNIGRAARPLKPYDKAGPTHAFVGHWGEGRAGGGGGIIGIAGQKEETMGVTRRKWDFFYASYEPAHMSLQRKNTKVKIARCSGMSKFCPPAAASRKSRQGNK